MDERRRSYLRPGYQSSFEPRYNNVQPNYMQAPRQAVPRERYRATQHDHPMYDVVEDDEYEQDVLDSFDERLLQQPYDDRQHQAMQGRARLSLAPASSRFFRSEAVDEGQSQLMYQETYDDMGPQAHPADFVRGSLNRFVYNADQSFDVSSDAQLDASSSPAFNAGRRRERQHEYIDSRHSSQFQPFEDLPLPATTNGRQTIGNTHQDEEPRHKQTPKGIGRPFQPPNSLTPSNAPPIVQDIPLVPTSALPDRLRTTFPFPTFNAVQSKCFDHIFRSDNNFVLASPTGSGKTAVLELAICRAVATNATGQYKVVYQAPTKALCSERQRDWEKKFAPIGLKCAELTGDSDASDLRNVQSTNIIITTPEKWDSITRKWKDYKKLMMLIKLFLIDEVHILNEDRGAVLEVVVSRMKSIGTDVRFIALSATIPNLQDVASWLGRNSTEPRTPALHEQFGEEFRPVKLRKHVCGYVCNNNNEFAFDKQLDAKLPDVISTYSERKPLMIFCATRNSTVNTARLIVNWWSSRNGRERLWNPPGQALHLENKDLREYVASGVAFHHAGLNLDDRLKVEQGFLKGDINVICCTSTLAVGINLPCHLVIVKNTVSWTQGGMQEYSDLEMMQMLGRAGRPQFDDNAIAVIMTRQNKVRRYETLITGEEVVESRLHLNLIDHMNAEIGLGTIRDLKSATDWLTGTFLHVRLQQNPAYYRLQNSRDGQDIKEQVDDICSRDIALLQDHNLVTGGQFLHCTDYGHAMARYYVHFETMKVILGLQSSSSLSEVLSAVAQASEFSSIRFRQGEKSLYKVLNKSPSIRFAIPVNLDLPAHKVSLIIQSVLGSADISWYGEPAKHKGQYFQDSAMVFKSISSLVRCVIDCQICTGGSVSIHSALMLERSLASRAWDDSPLQMIQLPGIGTVAVRKLVNAGVRGIEDLEATDARRIETIVGRNPPFGLKILEELKSFPRLRVSLHLQPSSVTQSQEGVVIQVKAEIGFLNEKPPSKFANKLIYICILAETSDGRKVHFARINGSKLNTGQSLMFPALLTCPGQKINCYLMCEGIAGSMRGATVTPQIAPTMFSTSNQKLTQQPAAPHQPNMSKRRIENVPVQRRKSATSDDFGDIDIDDEVLAKVSCEDLDFEHIDNFADPTDVITHNNTAKNKSSKGKARAKAVGFNAENDGGSEPTQLPNGRWACSHKCKDKEACKHYCCKHGMDKPPKKAASKCGSANQQQDQAFSESSTPEGVKVQSKLSLPASKRKVSSVIEELDLTEQEEKRRKEYTISGPRDHRDLHNLHKSVQKKDVPPSLYSVMHKKPAYSYGEGGQHQLSFLSQPTTARPLTSSEYGDLQLDEFEPDLPAAKMQPAYSDNTTSQHFSSKQTVPSYESDTFGDEDSLFGDAIVGLADSQDLQAASNTAIANLQTRNAQSSTALVAQHEDTDFSMVDLDFTAIKEVDPDQPEQRAILETKARTPVLQSTSSPEQYRSGIRPMDATPQGPVRQEKPPNQANPPESKSIVEDDEEEDDVMSDLLNLLDMPVSTQVESIESKQTSAANEVGSKIVEPGQEEQEQVPDAFKGLQPWLFQEFGDIVELVNE